MDYVDKIAELYKKAGIKDILSKIDAYAVVRADDGLRYRLDKAVEQGHKNRMNGMDNTAYFSNAAKAIGDWYIEKHHEHIAAALRKYGIELEDGVITVDSLVKTVSSYAEIKIDSLTPDAIRDAVMRAASARISEYLGVTVDLKSGYVDWQQVAIAAAAQAVATGRANRIVSAQTLHRLQTSRAFQAAGIMTAAERKRAKNRIYQREYRKTHRQVWYKTGQGGAGVAKE